MRTRRSKMKYAAVAISLLAGIGMTAHAQTSVWTGAVDNNWSTPGNWNPAGVPNGNTYTVMVESASASINVDGAYTINTFLISSNSVSDGSTVSLDGTGPLTMDINYGANAGFQAPGFNNDAVGIGTVLEVNCDVTIDNTLSGRTQVTQNSGTNNVVRFGTNCTLTINNDFLLNDNDGKVELNCTVLGLGSAYFNIWSQNNYFGPGYDDSGYGSIIVSAGTSKLTFNGGTVTAGSAVQLNGGNCTLVFNATNVADNLNIRALGSGASHLVVNQSQDNMGWLIVGGGSSTIDPVGGTIAFANSSGQTWGSGSLTVSTNFTFGDIRFGADSNALTVLQLEQIALEDFVGGAALDADGYLKFDAPPPVITGEIIVDYVSQYIVTNSRPADIVTSNGNTWVFSDTELLINEPVGQNRIIYGGMTSTWSVATNYVPEFGIINGRIWTKVDPRNGSSLTMKGMHVWPKEEFLLGANGTLSFTNGNEMLLSIEYQWGGGACRFVVKQGGIYYASEASAPSGVLSIDPGDPDLNWAPISTNDYIVDTFSYAPMTFTDVEAVGIAYDFSKGPSADVGCWVSINDFRVRANVDVPPPTEIADVALDLINGGSQVVLSWQGTNYATYAVQKKTDLISGEWSNVVTNLVGVEGLMSVTNDTTDPGAYYRTMAE